MITASPTGPRAKPLLRGEDIVEQYVLNRPSRYIDYNPDDMYLAMFPGLFESPKLIFRKIAGPEGLMAAVDEKGWYCFSTLICVVNHQHLKKVERAGIEKPSPVTRAFIDHHMVLAICNSAIVSWWYKETQGDELGVNPNHVKAIPLPKRLLDTPSEVAVERETLI